MIGGGDEPNRGLSSVTGTVLMFGVVLSVSLAVVVAGGAVLEASKTTTSMDGAAVSMAQLDTAITTLEQQPAGAGGASVGLGSADGNVDVYEDGTITVVVNDTSTAAEDMRAERTMGRIVYERDGQTVAYQGGGIWQTSGNGTAMVSPPNFDYAYRNGKPTLSLPIVELSGDASGDDLRLRRQSERQRLFPGVGSVGNPLDGAHEVEITVESEYYEAWGRFFEDTTNATITYDHGNGSVTLSMDGYQRTGDSVGALPSTVLTRSGTGITNAGRVDSYDSANGPYPGWRHGEDARIAVDDDFKMSETPRVSGDLIVTGHLEVDNDPIVYGRTITGGTPGAGDPDEVTNDAVFERAFSTTDDLEIGWGGGGAQFGDDLIVGGSITEFGLGRVDGTVHVGEDAHLDQASGPNDVYGDVVADGDVTLDDNVVLHGSDRTVVSNDSVHVSDGTHETDVVASGDVRVDAGATVDGDVDAGGDVYVNGDVTGTVTAGGNVYPSAEPGWDENASPTPPPMDRLKSPLEPTVSDPDPVADEIDAAGSRIGSDNDNGGQMGEIESYRGCDPDCTLEAGAYDLDGIDHRGTSGELVFDTTDGDVEVYVENDVEITETVRVTGPNQVRVYANGDFTLEGDSASVSTPDDNATQFQVFMRDGNTASLQSGSPTFAGVIYGPGETSDDSVEIVVTNDPTIYGALVGNVTQFNSDANLHYDEALGRGAGAGDDHDPGSRVSYFRFTTQEVVVED